MSKLLKKTFFDLNPFLGTNPIKRKEENQEI